MKKSYLAIIVILFISILVAVLLGIYDLNRPSKPVIVEDKVYVNTALVVRSDIPEVVSTIGTLKANKEVQVSSQINGQILQIFFKDGQKVNAGDALLKLDDVLTQAGLQSAKANFELSQKNYDRAVKLVKQNALAKQDFDTVKANYQNQMAGQKEAEAYLNKTLLVAPFPGVVGESKVSMGQFIKIGEPLVDLIDKSILKVEYSLPEQYLLKLKIGQPVIVTTNAAPGRIFHGAVTYIAPSIDPNSRTISLYAFVPNSNDILSPGSFVTVSQALGIKKNALVISEECLVPAIEGSTVYVIKNGKAYRTAIKTGAEVGNKVQVLSGLVSGELIVKNGQQKLRDGTPVQIVKGNHEAF